MPQLDNYLVTLGMQGQKFVLATMDKIRKKGGDLSKKKQIVKITPDTAKTGRAADARQKRESREKELGKAPDARQKRESREKELGKAPDKFKAGAQAFENATKETNRKRELNEGKFGKTVDKFKGGAQNFASAASTLDPAATISSVTSAIGTSLSGISVLGVSLGRLPEGIAHIANSTLSMAKSSIDMAKQATAAFHQLTTRNAAAAYYGEKVTKRGPLSRNEWAMFIDAVSGSMGKIQKPLADEINKLIGKKDTRALARVGAGDWESTGTDKGWMLGQLSSSFQGLPPTIKQKLQAALLKNYAGEIQGMAPGQRRTQQNAAWFADTEEAQTATIAGKSTGAVRGMTTNFNRMQVTLYDTGLKFAGAINATINTLNGLAVTIPKVTAALNELVKSPSLSSVKKAMTSFSGATPRAGK